MKHLHSIFRKDNEILYYRVYLSIMFIIFLEIQKEKQNGTCPNIIVVVVIIIVIVCFLYEFNSWYYFQTVLEI